MPHRFVACGAFAFYEISSGISKVYPAILPASNFSPV